MTTKKKPISNEPAETPITEGAQTQDEQKIEQAKPVMDSGPVAEGQQVVSIIRVEKRRLACKLSDDELRTYSDQLALVTQEISEEERAQKQAKEELKARPDVSGLIGPGGGLDAEGVMDACQWCRNAYSGVASTLI